MKISIMLLVFGIVLAHESVLGSFAPERDTVPEDDFIFDSKNQENDEQAPAAALVMGRYGGNSGGLDIEMTQTRGSDAGTVAQLNTMLNAGKSAETCISTAKKTIEDLCKEVSEAQKQIDKLSDGSECKTKGTDELQKQKKLRTEKAQKTKEKAQKKKKEDNRTFQCKSPEEFKASAEWKAKEQNLKNADIKLAVAKQAVTDAENAVTDAKKAAEKSQKTCKCDTHKAAETKLTDEKAQNKILKKAMVQEEMLICMAKQKKNGDQMDHSKCENELSQYENKCLSLKPRKMAEGVDASSCSETNGSGSAQSTGSGSGSHIGSGSGSGSGS